MKKTLFFIAVAMLFCTEMKAQDMTLAFNTPSSFQLNLTEQPQSDINQHYTRKNTYTFTNQASLSWEIIENLTFRSDFGLSWSFRDENYE